MGAKKKTLVVDNGSHEIRAGFLGSNPICFPNCIAETARGARKIGDEVSTCAEEFAIARPSERGLIVDWALQCEIWDRLFAQLSVAPADCRIIMTEPLLAPRSLRKLHYQVLLDDFGFAEVAVVPSSSFAAGSAATALVLDLGFSGAVAAPVYERRPVLAAVRRSFVGGRALSNRLRDIVDLKAYRLDGYPLLLDDMKHTCMRVALDVRAELAELPEKPARFALPATFETCKGRLLGEGEAVDLR